MGMSASQARYLGLTARRSNNEFEMQQIAQERITLAMNMDDVAKAYTDKVNNQQLLFVQIDPSSLQQTTTRLTYEIITNTNPFEGLNMRIVDSLGRIIVPNAIDTNLLRENALNEYQAAVTNKCFEKTSAAADGTTTKLLFTGANFINNYFSNNDYINPSNPILDKDGNAIDIAAFKEQISSMKAPAFYEFWTQNHYKFQDNSFPNSTDIAERAYTEDDSAALSTYNKNLADIIEKEKYTYSPDLNCLDADYLEEKLRSGEWRLQKQNPDVTGPEGKWIPTPWSSVASISDALDKSDDAQAETEYENKSAFFQREDKRLEMRQKQLDSEHNALQTEIDSVKKVIDKNVESSFKTFG